MQYFVGFLALIFILYLIWRFSIPKDHVIYWFYDPNCPHCTNMKEAWHNFVASTSMPTESVDVTNSGNVHITALLNVSTVPQIIRYSKTLKTVDMYQGDRSARDLLIWADEL
jgi:glutaredoxin